MANRNKDAERHGWDPEVDPKMPETPPDAPDNVDMSTVRIPCDDYLHMTSCIEAHPRYDGPEYGIACWYLVYHPQAKPETTMFAMYAEHVDAAIKALTAMRARMGKR